MDTEDKRLINGIVENTSCYLCGSPINVSADDLSEREDEIYVTDHYCTGCDVGYNIEIEDIGHMFSLSAYRMDTRGQEPDFPEILRNARKEALQQETHPIKDLVEGLDEMTVALTILQENRNRIHEAGNIIRDDGFRQDSDFDNRLTADLHNYMASSYSFEEVLETVDPHLPTGGPVESAKDSFDNENMLIKGLRTYVQHHLTLSHSFSEFYDENTEQREAGITVSMEDVGEDEVTDFQYGDPSISFEKVEGDTINLERRIGLHQEAAEELVRKLFEYAQTTHEDELKDYRESTSYQFE